MTPVSSRTTKRTRRPSHKRSRTRHRPDWLIRSIAIGVVLLLCWTAWAVIARRLTPVSNTARDRFDAIVVLGYPADPDGNPTPTQLARVTEAVNEYERGAAPHLIVTGGAGTKDHIEALTMARTAEAQGVPAEAVVIERRADDTIQSACYVGQIMHARGWRSAELISSAYHLPRAAMIFSRLPIEWRTHVAPALQPESTINIAAIEALETLKTMRYVAWANWSERCKP